MGADMKSLRVRIRSTDSTLHLTKAMGLVASSKIRRASDAMTRGRAYAAGAARTVETLTRSPECRKSPYMRSSDGGKTLLVVIAGDRGLCGGYNGNIFRFMREYPDADVIPIGRRACARYGGESIAAEGYPSSHGHALAEKLCKSFCAGEYGRVGIVTTKYVSVLSQIPEVRWVLPLTASDGAAEGTVFEPDEATVLEYAVPEYVAGMIMAAVREGFACEVAARRTAMDSAGKNAQEMIDTLQLRYNRARQGAITQEITEIVAGSGE